MLLKASLALLAAIFARWQGEPPIKQLSFFFLNLETIDFFLPIIALVLFKAYTILNYLLNFYFYGL